MLPYLTGKEEKGARTEYFYFSDDGDLLSFRYDNWKVNFMGTTGSWNNVSMGRTIC